MASAALFLGTLFLKGPGLSAETDQGRMVRLAELEIDPAQLNLYKAARREEIATSIRDVVVFTLPARRPESRQAGIHVSSRQDTACRAPPRRSPSAHR